MNKEIKECLFSGQDLIDFLPDPTYAIDTQGHVILWNQAIEKLTGIRAPDIIGKGNYEYSIPFYHTRRPILSDLLLNPDPDIEKLYQEFKRTGDYLYGECYVPGLMNGGVYLWCIAKTIYDGSGRIAGVIESIREITAHRKASETIIQQNTELESANRQLMQAKEDIIKTNELLRLSDEKFSKAFKNSPVVLSLSTVSEGRYLDVSDNFYSETGWSSDEVIGHTVNDLNIWVDENERQRVISELKQHGCARELEIRFRKKDGEIRTKLFSGDIIEVGGVPCLLAMNSDITDRITIEVANRLQKIELEKVNAELKTTIQEMEKAHRELTATQQELVEANKRLLFSEEKFSKTVHLGPVIITLSRLSDGVYIDASEYFLKLTGYSREEVVGHSALELNIWADVEDRNRVMTMLKQDGVVRGLEIKFLARDGSIFFMNYSAEVITIAGELHLVSVAVDITANKKSEEEKSKLEHQLLQSQKMETVGRLAGGIAHDFNNLLTAILGNVELCMAKAGTGSILYPKLEMIKKASESAADLTRRILAFSRKQIIEPEVIDLNDMISHMNIMLERVIGEDIQLSTVTLASNPNVLADAGQLEQVIMNLSVNARDAMTEGGTLTVKTENVLLDSEYCRIHAYAIPGEYVLLTVTDNGCGMSTEVRKHLFEPFYTTKPKGKGTGLGLSMVYGSIKQNNGSVEVESEPGKGTCFKIYLPVYYGDVVPAPGRPARDIKYEGEETILLVEDNQMVLEFAAHVLEEAGFRVLEAQSGETAQDIESSYTGKIDLLVTDVVMPGINGKALAEILRKKRPEMKVILTSGYTEDIIKHQSLSGSGSGFIGKPYSANSLLQKVREVLDM